MNFTFTFYKCILLKQFAHMRQNSNTLSITMKLTPIAHFAGIVKEQHSSSLTGQFNPKVKQPITTAASFM